MAIEANYKQIFAVKCDLSGLATFRAQNRYCAKLKIWLNRTRNWRAPFSWLYRAILERAGFASGLRSKMKISFPTIDFCQTRIRKKSKTRFRQNSNRSIIEIKRVVLAEIESTAKARHRLIVGSHASALLSRGIRWLLAAPVAVLLSPPPDLRTFPLALSREP
jgi:hypothetical protein